ncbi:MAG: bifunctional metallophosphatase/5'-nucleotidase [Kiritimatiellae bacterium]|jgi:2',3'-cyclic-nucleotide 2'-phosphodiesterase (5'-nucleotidase family)|nr:bifunctional metallophosphatase/5'-nucleotidase [Kiritimatiellia bacterium]NLD90248.1 bifunctional metallophosphatase/5'-nucleotidase [Lentisphaerota bacterium]HQN79750.1 bifunctional UDP-sugar hydrolase/5'-nucleotidase [Kiritimatiellia bacterium]HQQ60966.1 bifunctional UDP-sugar hydrolase/5'-nucleotidase [Kiritimatiellia bacterium]
MMRRRPAPGSHLRACAGRFFIGVVLAAAAAEGRLVTLTVLNTTDLHGSIRRTPGVYADHNEGALLQCATLIRGIRKEQPNTLLLDGGDAFQGTAESYLSRGGVMARAMNALGYDAYAIGNHDFDWGVTTLGKLLEQMEVPVLAANLLAGPAAPAAFRRVQPYILREMDGLRIAVVGLTTPNIPNWCREVTARDLRLVDSRRALERILPEVRRHQPHILLLLVHQGLLTQDDAANEIRGICRRFGEFDLVLGGHLHWLLAGVRIGKTDYVQAGSGARGVMRIDLVYDTVAQAVVDKKFEWLPVTARRKADPVLWKLVEADLARADAWLETVVGTTVEELSCSPAPPGLCPVQQLLCAAIAEKTGAEVVLHGVLSDKSISAGEIRVADIWQIVPYENTAGCLWLTIGEIQAIMEEAADFLGTDRYFGAWGLRYEIHPGAPPGRRIRNLLWADGRAINGRRRLKVALNSYHLAGGGGRFPAIVRAAGTPNTRLETGPELIRDMVMDYIRVRSPLSIPPGTNAVVVTREPVRWQRKKTPAAAGPAEGSP